MRSKVFDLEHLQPGVIRWNRVRDYSQAEMANHGKEVGFGPRCPRKRDSVETAQPRGATNRAGHPECFAPVIVVRKRFRELEDRRQTDDPRIGRTGWLWRRPGYRREGRYGAQSVLGLKNADQHFVAGAGRDSGGGHAGAGLAPGDASRV